MPDWKRILKTAVNPAVRKHARRKIDELRRIDVPAAKRVAEAIDEAIIHRLTLDEQDRVNAIEMLRVELEQSSTVIPFVDFGAGDAKDSRTAQQMVAGSIESRTVSQICRASKAPFWALLLFKLIRKLQPKVAIELGTCLGISAAYQAGAQKINGKGKTVTLEGAPALASLSRGHLASLGLDNAEVVTGRFSDTLAQTLEANAPIDYAFVDGHHDEKATIAYYRQFLPYLARDTVLVFDDITWSAGMRRAW